jgi:hypothetical protein
VVGVFRLDEVDRVVVEDFRVELRVVAWVLVDNVEGFGSNVVVVKVDAMVVLVV